MSKKKQIAVRTCGGCACEFDRRGVINELKESFETTCEFKFSYDTSQDSNYDYILLINGCDSACAPAAEKSDEYVIVINHTNNKVAKEVFMTAIG